ncbi:hypothetical protein PXH69_21740 [Rhodococcus qingshengii]|uniref:Uncharacterized protein n=1 Tax=Rhodococcus qingshengii TaxID=334542 RepID=A0AAW6LQQ8_RHOSG|nr:hypothetical protein [Rhodococcus qingshengii]MDE8647601.1 hypothetical protein [Rhodococcus qingshengii]
MISKLLDKKGKKAGCDCAITADGKKKPPPPPRRASTLTQSGTHNPIHQTQVTYLNYN